MKKAVMILAADGVSAGALVLAEGALAQGGGSTAVDWMTADTMSGMAGMMGGAGGRPSGRAVLGAMMGRGGGFGGNGYVKPLHLQLGSGQRPAAEPPAEHVPPAGLGAGP